LLEKANRALEYIFLASTCFTKVENKRKMGKEERGGGV
jgi:hypothetical protein